MWSAAGGMDGRVRGGAARPSLLWLCVVCLWVAAWGAPSVAWAQKSAGGEEEDEGSQEDPVGVSAEVAFGGLYRPGRSVVTLVDLENRGPERAVELRLESVDVTRSLRVDLGARARKRVQVVAPAPSLGRSWKVRVVDPKTKERLGAAAPKMKRAEEGYTTAAFVGKRPPGFRDGELDLNDPKALEDPNLLNVGLNGYWRVGRGAVGDLPEAHEGYEPLDVLYWSNPRYDQLAPTQVSALERWVFSGGHLVVAVDEGWESVARSGLGRLLPMELTGVEVSARASLENALVRPALLEDLQGSQAKPLSEQVPVLGGAPRRGAGPGPESEGQAFALSYSWEVGAGRVTVWRVTPERWATEPTPDQWVAWLGRRTRPAQAEGLWSVVSVDEPKLAFNAWVLLGILGLYLLVIGPVDYLVLRALKRLEWTLVTYPASVVVFGGLTWVAMAGSLDAGSVAIGLEFVTWDLPQEALTGGAAPSRARQAFEGRRVERLEAFFPDKRQRLELSASVPEASLRGSKANVYSELTQAWELEGSPARLKTVAAAYAMLPVRQVHFFPASDEPPIKVSFEAGQDPAGPPVLEVSPGSLGAAPACWLRYGRWLSDKHFAIPAQGKVALTLRETTPGEVPSVVIQDWGSGGPTQILASASYVVGAGPLVEGQGELLCVFEGAPELAVQGLKPEQRVERKLYRFLF